MIICLCGVRCGDGTISCPSCGRIFDPIRGIDLIPYYADYDLTDHPDIVADILELDPDFTDYDLPLPLPDLE